MSGFSVSSSVRVTIAAVVVGSLIAVWATIAQYKAFSEAQYTLARTSAEAIAGEIEVYLSGLRRSVQIFVLEHLDEIVGVSSPPVWPGAAEQLREHVAQHFPQHVAVTIGTRSGESLLSTIDHLVGPACRSDMALFAEDHLPRAAIHSRDGMVVHFDVMTPIETGDGEVRVFFISFPVDTLQRLLAASQFSLHQPVLVRRDRPEVIELAADSMLSRSISRADGEVMASAPVAGSVWSLTAFRNEAVFTEMRWVLGTQAGGIILVLTLVGGVVAWRGGQEERLRREAEVALARAHDDLERQVDERTRELAEALDYNRALFDNLPVGLALCRMDGSLVDVNQAYADILGRTIEETKALTYWEVTPRDFAVQEQQQLARLENQGRYGPYEKEYLHRDGRRVPVRLQGRLIVLGGEQYIWSSVEDVSEKRTSEAALRKLYRAVEQSPVMIFITDTEGVIEYVNPKFTEVTGYTWGDAVGRTPRIIRSSFTPREVHEDLWQTITAGYEWRWELQDRRKNGSTFWASVFISPVRDDSGTITHYVAMHEDITERRQNEEHVRAAREQADVANRAKSELLANMSHELRTPLNAIIGFSRTLKEGVFGDLANAKQAEYVADILDSGQHLLEVVNDVLDVSAIEAGKLELNEEEVGLRSVCDACIKLVAPRAEEAKVSIQTEADGAPMIFADKRRTKQILLNLLSNAVKFSPEGGGITVFAGLDGTGRPILSVSDDGVGMDEDELAIALSQFGQVDGSLARKHEGTGLGLPLTRGLVEAHGGTMEVVSAKGRGTTVTVTLPRERGLADAKA